MYLDVKVKAFKQVLGTPSLYRVNAEKLNENGSRRQLIGADKPRETDHPHHR